MTALENDILRAASEVQRRTYRRPKVIRCAPSVAYEIMRDARAEIGSYNGMFGPPGVDIPDYLAPRPGALGLAIETDEYLTSGAWRLCDADQTLLYDCREGTSPL